MYIIYIYSINTYIYILRMYTIYIFIERIHIMIYTGPYCV